MVVTLCSLCIACLAFLLLEIVFRRQNSQKLCSFVKTVTCKNHTFLLVRTQTHFRSQYKKKSYRVFVEGPRVMLTYGWPTKIHHHCRALSFLVQWHSLVD